MKTIDLRSDTVTLPTAEMLEAIVEAELGDDVYQEDPTVTKLEELAAQKMGKDNALLVTSGTQANLVSLMANANRGDGIIVEENSHMYLNELGGMSSIAGVLPRPIRGHLGALDPQDVEKAITRKSLHRAGTVLVCIENTHNQMGGTVITPKQIRSLSDVVKTHNLRLYMDGARIFNAAVALRVDVKAFTRHVDSLMFCLSKGLSAPIGSVVVGSEDFIEKARRVRKMVGGGMRQAGIIAAPGIIALEKMVDRLKEDHDHATLLAEGLSRMGFTINLETVQTNIVRFDLKDLRISSSEFVTRLAERGIKSDIGRMVTHRGVTREDIELTLAKVKEIIQ